MLWNQNSGQFGTTFSISVVTPKKIAIFTKHIHTWPRAEYRSSQLILPQPFDMYIIIIH